MKILGAGLSRTGTQSLNKAMKILGYHSDHFDPKFIEDIQLAGSTGQLDLSRYDKLDAIFDAPQCLFYREFLERYPDLKVLLSVRDEEAWWKSIRRNLELLPISGPRDNRTGWMWPAMTWHQRVMSFGLPTANEFIYRQRYRTHNEAVKAFVPPDQLLVLDVTAGHGWGPLCEFLGHPVPEIPFPWLGGRKMK